MRITRFIKPASTLFLSYCTQTTEHLPTHGRTARDSISHAVLSYQGVFMKKKRSKRRRYPKDWNQQADACKERAGWKCEACCEENLTWKVSRRTGLVYQMRLHAAHTGRYTKRPTLKALCPSCHARMDWERRKRKARIQLERMRHIRLRTVRCRSIASYA